MYLLTFQIEYKIRDLLGLLQDKTQKERVSTESMNYLIFSLVFSRDFYNPILLAEIYGNMDCHF